MNAVSRDTQPAQQSTPKIGKVVVLNDTSVPGGGTAGLALLSIEALRARGIAVEVLSGDAGQNPDLAALGVPITAAGEAPLLQRGRAEAARRGLHNPAAKAMVATYIAQHDTPDTVYHLHAWAQILSPSVFAALAPVAHRTYIHAHDMFIACPNGVFMDYQRQEVCRRTALSLGCIATQCDKRSYPHKLWRVARGAVLKRCFDTGLPWAGVIQIHPDMAPRLARGGIPEPLCRTLRNPAAPFTDRRIAAEANQGLIYVGRLEIDKGVLALAEAARRTGTQVTFIGDGAERARLERDFPEFPVTGWLSRDKIGALAAQARALVMPSLHPEPFSLVLPEAIHSGLPVLVAETALMAAEIDAAGLGLRFDPRDAKSFDSALRRVATLDPARLKEMSLAGAADTGRLALSVDDWADGLVALYHEALLRHRPS